MAPPVDTPNGKTAPDTVEKAPKSRPEKPDEETYKTDLSKAEKEHAVAQEKLVCLLRVVTSSSFNRILTSSVPMAHIYMIRYSVLMPYTECYQGQAGSYETS